MTNYYDLFKVSKMTIYMTCSKLAVLNKAILGAFFKSQKSKNRLKMYVKITDSYLFEKQWQIKRSMTLF